MKRLITLFALGLISILANAQTITVTSMEELSFDLYARTNQKLDNNKVPCAVVKVDIPSVTGIQFSNNQVISQEYTPGEYILYVPAGTKKIDYQHKDFYSGSINFADYGITLQSNVTYRVILLAKGKSSTGPAITSQYIVFKVNPAESIVTLAGEPLITDADGVAQKYVPFGTYQYIVESPDYHTEVGEIIVADAEHKVNLDVSLKPAFGYLAIYNITDSEAKVYIDNKLAGSLPINRLQLPSGSHTVKIVRNLYNPYENIVEINDSQVTTLAPDFSANFSNVTFAAPEGSPDDSEIWVNDEFMANRVWTSDLPKGSYKVELKREHYQSSLQIVEVAGSGTSEHIVLEPIIPIYGALNINSNVNGADIYIDDVLVGQTPMVVSKVLEGSHKVRVSKEMMSNWDNEIIVIADQTSDMFAELSATGNINIVCPDAPSYLIYVDGESYSSEKKYSFGEHILTVNASGYFPYEERILVSDTNSDFKITLIKKVRVSVQCKEKFSKCTFTIDDVEYAYDTNAKDHLYDISPGYHTFVLKAKGFKKAEIFENVQTSKSLEFVLKEKTTFGEVLLYILLTPLVLLM